METAKLKKFAQFARRSLLEQVSSKLKLVLLDDSAARRESPVAVKQLEEQIKIHGREQVIERVAYIWFNRFCALRFMDVNRYTRIGVVSPAEGQFQPEILAEAKMGHIDEAMAPDNIRQRIFALLDGKAPSRDPQGEAYRLLVVAACNDWHRAMPFLFQRIDDYTELLMPDDLLSGNSILATTREAMTPDACEDVEVIGWLYQFYISEKKDEVFEGLKKNKKITPENIPAATQLFTPHWIVRYLVENSLGRLWMLNRPNSRLVDQMDYYIKETTEHTENTENKDLKNSVSSVCSVVQISSPEDIKICDPACGSGHMLTYAFDLLYAIYEEEGYEPSEIPEKILTHNLYGIEIDERAGELAAFALTMKARAKQRRFFRRPVQPNICVLENIHFEEDELKEYMDFIGRDLFTAPLKTTLRQFEEAKNFGSLIRPEVTDVEGMLNILEAKDVSGQLFLSETHKKVLQALRQANYLSPKYHVVIANPPYMGGKGMNGRLGTWVKENYPNSKADLMTCFMERAQDLSTKKAFWGMISLPSWMFLSSFEKMRIAFIKNQSILSLLHLGRGVFGSDFGSVAFVLQNVEPRKKDEGVYRRLFEDHVQIRSPDKIRDIFLDKSHGRYLINQGEFKKVPGHPIAYWVSNVIRDVFDQVPSLGDTVDAKQGLATADNNRFLRLWWECSRKRISFDSRSRETARSTDCKWFPYNKGGDFRKWYGNQEHVLNWENDGKELFEFKPRSVIRNPDYYFRESISWSDVTISNSSFRWYPAGFVFDSTGHSAFVKDQCTKEQLLSFCNSKFANQLIKILNPTIHFHVGYFNSMPSALIDQNIAFSIVTAGIQTEKEDWDSFETSWDFTSLPLLQPDYRQPTLKATYTKLRAHWLEMTLEMQRLEEENNRIFIEAYGLQDELTPEVPLNEITLTCNPHYRYGGDKSEEELEALLLADTMREFISYAVGCVFGRYSLDAPGLILANQGETVADYIRKVASGQWLVASKEEGERYASEELQGSHRVAEGNGPRASGLSSNQSISEGGALRIDQSGETSGSVDSVEHSGRAGTAIGGGVQKLPVDSAGLVGGSGNPTSDRNATQLSNPRTTEANHGGSSGNQQNDSGLDGKTSHWSLATGHCAEISFMPDADNVIPILENSWFTDDISERFQRFLKVTFGRDHFEENLRFIEKALGKTIRKYFLRDFYNDHVRRYKKRPIYWLFSSPKGSFNALIYMHRYRPDTVSVVLNDYLREFRAKLIARKHHLEAVSISASASQSEKTKALKEIESLKKILDELDTYEREVLYPLATEQVEIDLDDGVKVNYPKFGAALKKIPGLAADGN